MAKRRTKIQKAKAKHDFLISWQPTPQKTSSGKAVNSQFTSTSFHKSTQVSGAKKGDNLDKSTSTATIKRDIAKSLISASLVLALEIVLYLAWQS